MRPTLWPRLPAAAPSTLLPPPRAGGGAGAAPPPPPLPMDIDIATIDTGLSFPREDIFAYRATDCTGAIFYPLFGGCTGSGNLQDGHGHGTHGAGIARARDNTVGGIGPA